MDERATRIYAEMLRTRLKKSMPEHTARLDSLPDEVLIEQERRHTQLRVETFKSRVSVALRKMR